MLKFRRVGAAKALLAVLIFVMAAFILLSFSKEKFDARALLFMALTMLLIMVQHMLLCFILPNGDRLTGVLVGFLMGIGLVMQYRLDADTALRQLIFSCFGLAAMVIMLMLMKKPIVLMYLRIPAAIISLGILGALMFVGKESGGAVNWISIGGILFQPSEFVKIAMIIVLAGAMSERTSLRELIVPTLFAVAVCALLVLQRDLGAAMLMAMVYMLMFYAATCKLGTTLLGAAACGVGAVASYYLFDHVKRRVAVWRDPWATYSTSGYQIAQGLMAIASGGLLGMGLGLGSPKLIPAYRTDYIPYNSDTRLHGCAKRQKQVRQPLRVRCKRTDSRAGIYNNRRGDKANPAYGHNNAVCKLRREFAYSVHDAPRNNTGRVGHGRGRA